MQNIYLTNYSKTQLGISSVISVAFNQLTNILYILDQSYSIHFVEYQPASETFHIKNKLDNVEDLAGLNIVNFTYIVDKNSLYVVSQEGSIIKISEVGETQILACNEDGIQCASWSPSQQFLLIVSKNNTLIKLNPEADLIAEVSLNDDQLQGNHNQCHISWKPDGKYFSINFAVSNGRKCLTRDCMLNVFKSPAKSDPEDKGLVQSVSQKPIKALGPLVSWQPAGGIIAGIDIKNNKKRVIFWQKNGLRHLEFTLPQWISEVNQLSWSNDSQILFIDVHTENKRQLLLYRRANYHWYLKTALQLKKSDKILTPKYRKNKIIIVGESIELIQLSIQFSENQWIDFSIQQKNSSVLYYSVDQNKIHITDYSKAIIPPPFSLFQFQVNRPILGVAKKQQYILVITEKEICVYNCFKRQIMLKIQNSTNTNRYWNLELIEVEPLKFRNGKTIYETNQKKQLSITEGEMRNNKKIIQIGEETIQFNFENNKLFVNQKIISQQCTSFTIYDVFLLFTNNSTGMYQKLYVFNLQISDFIWHSESDVINQLPNFQEKSLNVRLIERGSKIIGCSLGRVIFQLPRGNLETIYPKIICIKNTKRQIEAMNYLKAFELIRTHKLDMNLVFDINPSQFLENTDKVLQNISKIDYINLLISNLKEGISSQLKYCLTNSELEKIQEFFLVQIASNKIKIVCQSISKTLRNINKDKYILSIFTSEVKKGDLAQVLMQIKSIRQNDVQTVISPHLQSETKKLKKLNSRQILQYVCWLADAQIIYQVALLTYDLELVSMAAQFTQKDPKQYVPYLEQLKNINNEIQRRTKICIDLKKYDQAVQQLSKGNVEDKKKSIKLIKQHQLFKKGIQVYRNDPDFLIQTRILIAQYLESKQQLNEAQIIYQTSGLLEKALEISLKAFDVKKSKELMIKLNYTNQKIIEVIKGLISKVPQGSNNKFLSRAYLEIGDYESSIKMYLKQQNYKKVALLIKYVNQTFINNEIIPAFKLAFSLKYNYVLKQKKTFLQKHARLLTIQKNKKNQININIVTRQGDQMYSQISGMSNQSKSNYTVSTTTGMKKKKIKVKGILQRNVKQGSALQQDYIVAFLNDMISKCPETIKQCKILIQHLIYVNLIEQAEILRDEAKQYSITLNKRIRMYKEIKYEQQHQQIWNIYPPYVPKAQDNIQSFDYLL